MTNVSTVGNVQQITVELDPSVGSATAVNVSVFTGPPLASIFNTALTSSAVLNSLTQALRAMPANLLQLTPQNINVPQQIIQTYQPPGGSLFFPNVLFQMQFSISRIVARPLDAAQPGPGVLAVAVDVSQPVATSGDPSSLTDLTTPVISGPTVVSSGDNGANFAGGGQVADSCDIALYIDTSWVTNIVNNVISPQLSNKFLPQLAKNMVSFNGDPDCLQISFTNVTASLDDPLSPPIPTNVPMAGINLQCKMTKYSSVSQDSLGYYQGSGFSIDATFSAQIVLLGISNGSAYYAPRVIGHDISLPWWVDVLALFLSPAYIEGSAILGIFGVDIFYPSIVANANNQAGKGLDTALGGLFQDQPAELAAQLPGTTAPDWDLSIAAIGTSSDACYSCVDLTLSGYPYLMLTDQPVADPSAAPKAEFPGSFNWPGIAYNQPGQGGLGGSYDWDVHDLNPIGIILKIPPGLFNPQDPTLFVTWTATRTDTDVPILSFTQGLNQPGALAITIDHASAAMQAADQFHITCTVTQAVAEGGFEQVFSSGDVYINIQDVLYDRHHPYVTWGPHNKYIYPGAPFWVAVFHPVPGRRWVKLMRASRIHRTDYWEGGRRWAVAETSGLMGNLPSHGPGKGMLNRANSLRDIGAFNYLDSLPISLAEVEGDRNLARGVLCDYCFFGGPTKIALRTDFPTSSGLPPQ